MARSALLVCAMLALAGAAAAQDVSGTGCKKCSSTATALTSVTCGIDSKRQVVSFAGVTCGNATSTTTINTGGITKLVVYRSNANAGIAKIEITGTRGNFTCGSGSSSGRNTTLTPKTTGQCLTRFGYKLCSKPGPFAYKGTCGCWGTCPPPLPSDPSSSVSKYISRDLWAQFFPFSTNGSCSTVTGFYTYDAFLAAANTFPGFGTRDSDDVNKRVLAAFLGQISHETTGGWPTAPGGPQSWGLCFKDEGAGTQTDPYCNPTPQYPCAAGKLYYGRGPMQLSWNYNYIPTGQALGFDGLNDPAAVSRDAVLSFKTAIYFWITASGNKPSCDDVMAGRWVPSARDVAAGRKPGYGTVTNVVNGGIECGLGRITDKQQDRIDFYIRYASSLGVGVGDNLDCANASNFNV